MKEHRCALCGSDAISIYHCTKCQYAGPLIVRIETPQPPGNQFISREEIIQAGSFWSETGIGNRSLFET